MALASANIMGLLFLDSGLLSDLSEKSGREQKGTAASQDVCLISKLSIFHTSPARGPSAGSQRAPKGTDTTP